MGLRLRMPSFKLRVDGAEGREAHLENDDLLPTTKENRYVRPTTEKLKADWIELGASGHSPFSGSVRLVRLPNGWEPIPF